jgi:hypothetical protein
MRYIWDVGALSRLIAMHVCSEYARIGKAAAKRCEGHILLARQLAVEYP